MGRIERHLPVPCRPSSFQHTLRSPWHKPTPIQSPAPERSDNTGAIEKEDSMMQMEKNTAPKATPEDSLIDSYSTGSEEDRKRLCELLEEREDFDVEDATALESMQTDMLNDVAKYNGSDVVLDPGPTDLYRIESDVSKDTLVHDNLCPAGEELTKQWDAKNYLLCKLSASEQFDSSSSFQFSQSSHSGSHIVFTGSGSSLPGRFHHHNPLVVDRTELDNPCSSVSLLQADTSTTGPEDGQSSPSSSTHKHNPSFTLNLNTLGKLVVPSAPAGQCQLCGLSPGSPTYFERHTKFCHTGAHALDMFFSPDEVPSPTGLLWRPVASTVQDSPTRCSLEQFSPFGSPSATKAQHMAMDMTLASIEGYTEDEEEEEEDVDMCHRQPPLPPSAHKCHSPTHIPVVDTPFVPPSATINVTNAKRTAPSKVKSKSTNPSKSKSKRLSKNCVYSVIGDTSLR